LSEKEFNRVHKRGLYITEREKKRRGMEADLCTNGNGRESVDGLDVHLVVHTGVERGDEVGVGGVEGLAAGNVG